MRIEPQVKRAVSFFDGQNLFYAVKQAFGYLHPNYEPRELAQAVCRMRGWQLAAVRFYTGIPGPLDDPRWNRFWSAKLGVMGTRGVYTFTRHLKYRNQTVAVPGGGNTTVLVGQEKGIDVRIALDIVRMARNNEYDVALVFSQDQDLSEAVDEVKYISSQQDRWIRAACAYPVSPTSTNTRGINGTDWIPIERAMYTACIDPNDYRMTDYRMM